MKMTIFQRSVRADGVRTDLREPHMEYGRVDEGPSVRTEFLKAPSARTDLPGEDRFSVFIERDVRLCAS